MSRIRKELRTFQRPEQVDRAPPDVGAPAPPTSLFKAEGLPVVVGFLRHCGCPFAEKMLTDLRRLADTHAQIHFIAVSHADEELTNAWVQEAGGPGKVRIVSDAARREYNAWGVGISDLWHFLGGRALLSVVELLPQGIKNRSPAGSRWQMAGAFAVDKNGVVRFAHLPEHAGDLPDLESAARSVEP